MNMEENEVFLDIHVVMACIAIGNLKHYIWQVIVNIIIKAK